MALPSALITSLAERYRVERELGAGGMATVYLAEDLKHGRQVAIKVLHPDLGAALGGERFLAEIRTTAKLQHPHILPLLDSGDAGNGLLYYVMPYVRGETLRARLERDRQLPIADAVLIAREVADALQHAHAQGIVHRDIKPENILLQDGHALVADFGIALAVQTAGGARMTQTGLSLGTPQYMSPEQAMGERSIDARSDIYALGAVTYEMLAGEPPFTGANIQAIVAKVLSERAVALATLRDTVPATLDEAIRRALAKLPADRFSSAQEFAQAVTASQGGGTGASLEVAAKRERRAGPIVLAGVAMALLGAATTWMIMRGRDAAPETVPVTRFVIPPSSGERISVRLVTNVFALSRDGGTLVYLASRDGKAEQLFRRRLDEVDGVPIEGTQGASSPAFSPDGKWLAFASGSQLLRIPVSGGAAEAIAPVRSQGVRGIAWTDDGQLVFGNTDTRELLTVPATGGTPRPLVKLRGELWPRWPIVVPGSEYVVFTEYHAIQSEVHVAVASLKSGEYRRVELPLRGFVTAVGTWHGTLVVASQSGDLLRFDFDPKTARVSGSPIRLASQIQRNFAIGLAFAATSSAGDVVFREGIDGTQLMFADAAGRMTAAVTDTGMFAGPRFSPDGAVLAYSVDHPGGRSVWLLDRRSGTSTRLTEDEPGVTRFHSEWTPDGRRLYYDYISSTEAGMRWRAVDRSGREERFPSPDGFEYASMAPDGRHVVAAVSQTLRDPERDLWWWTTDDTTAHRIAFGSATEGAPRFSPDGKWIAYMSNESGVRQLYVTPFPGPGARLQVSADHALGAVWGRDGRTLYFAHGPEGEEMSVATLAFTPRPTVVSTRSLFTDARMVHGLGYASFDVGPNGEFAIVRAIREQRTIVIRGAMGIRGDGEPRE